MAGLLLAGILSACGTHGNADVAAEAVTRFHHNLDEGLYQAILLDGTTEYRGTSANADYLKRAHEKGCKIKSTTGGRLGSQVMGDMTQVTLLYKTQFEQGTGSETFVWGVKDGRAILMFYEVRGLPGVNLD
jgi:hypothetical protein